MVAAMTGIVNTEGTRPMAKEDGLARFTQAAGVAGVEVRPVRYPAGTRTAADAAAAIGCDVSQIAKTLVCTGPTGPVLALTAGHNRVDLDRLGGLVGGGVRMANADEVRAATGYAIGGTPPFGHPEKIPTFIDPDLCVHQTIYGASGTPDSCFPIAPAELIRVTGAAEEVFTVQ